MKTLIFFLFLLLSSCGYTTQLSTRKGGIYVKPVVNRIVIASEDRAYSGYSSYPILLEKKLTNSVINEFNIRGGQFTVPNNSPDSYTLECSIYDYRREALRYTDDDSVSEQRLRLYVKVKFYDSDDEIIKEKEIVGEATYFLSGSYAIPESEAIRNLTDDSAKRIVETVSQDW